MKGSVPIVRQIAWLSFLPQLLIIGLMIYMYSLLDIHDSLLAGTSTYLILSLSLRHLIPRDHRKGMRLVNKHSFEEAIPFFDKSVAYFSKNSWIDKFRFITLLSSSKMAYREMGLCNIAFCYGQIGNGKKAREYYSNVLLQYPDNGLAISALNMIKAAQKESSLP